MAGTSGAAEASVLFKGRMMTLTVLEIRASDCERIAADIANQLARAPSFFTRMPVLLSLNGVLPDLVRVREILQAAELLVVGVLDADGKAAEAAAAAGLGTISSPARGDAEAPRPRAVKTSEAVEPSPPRADEKPVKTPTRLVTKPVRSGQQIFARGGDLVIANSVSEGAEILADGHIHIYGVLRGRALAGASGDVQARIFCRRFEPDLIAIAGCYKVADAIDDALRSKAVQVHLVNDNLTIELQE